MIIPTPNFDRLLDLVAAKRWPRDQIVLCGSAVLAALGIRDVGDLDLLVTRDLFESISLDPDFESQSDHPYDDRIILRGKGMDVFRTLPRVPDHTDRALESAHSTWIDPQGAAWRVLDARLVLAIKALAPPAPKHTEDMVTLARVIRGDFR